MQMKIGCMIWRIGDILDFYAQIAWIKTHGFDAVEFWTSPGKPGIWQGFDVRRASRGEITHLKQALEGFKEIDIHADFDEAEARARMDPVFALAADIGAKVITVHPHPDISESAEIEALKSLNDLAEQYEICVGIEPMGGIKAAHRMQRIAKLSLPYVGITLDIGHMYLEEGTAFEAYGTLGTLVDRVNVEIFHVHAHDYDGLKDHIAIGHGYIDFVDIMNALARAGFSGSLCLEINPDREPPACILESQARLRELIAN
jgi:sugar phosphate isomerase/epimerase